jgi:hypothetical protein
VNKASGLAVALDELGLSPRNTVAIGDGENDDECHLVAGQAEPASEAPKRIQCSSDSISASSP